MIHFLRLNPVALNGHGAVRGRKNIQRLSIHTSRHKIGIVGGVKKTVAISSWRPFCLFDPLLRQKAATLINPTARQHIPIGSEIAGTQKQPCSPQCMPLWSGAPGIPAKMKGIEKLFLQKSCCSSSRHLLNHTGKQVIIHIAVHKRPLPRLI